MKIDIITFAYHLKILKEYHKQIMKNTDIKDEFPPLESPKFIAFTMRGSKIFKCKFGGIERATKLATKKWGPCVVDRYVGDVEIDK